MGGYGLTDPIIKSANGSGKLVDPAGQPLRRMNHCIAVDCGVEIDPPHQFCAEHFKNVPVHLRYLISHELTWCRENNHGDNATRLLVQAVCMREAAWRAHNDPAFALRLAKLEAEAEAKVVKA